MRCLLLVSLVCCRPAYGALVDGMDDPRRLGAHGGVRPLSLETKDGRRGVHMGFACTSKPLRWITRQFDPPQDWRGYDVLRWSVLASTTGEQSHIQVQLLDASGNEVLVRRHLATRHLGTWQEMDWGFAAAKPKKDRAMDFSRVRLLIFSAWGGHYGHDIGDKVDYWIGPVTRHRAFEPAVLAAAPTRAPPALDGKLDDPCWQTTPAVEQFHLLKGMALPKEATGVQLLWDRTALYVGMRCGSAALDPAQQRLGEFRARVRTDGAEVFRDDSVEVFLAPRHAPAAYMQFAANALGTRFEARGLDTAWDAPWRAAGAMHNGYWVAELAIPWASLGVKPQAGAVVWANFCRNNRTEDEHSTWSPVTRTFHASDEFGQVLLLAEPPPVVVRSGPMPTLLVGRNTIPVTAIGRAGGQISVRCRTRQGRQTHIDRQTVHVAAGTQHRVDVPVEVAGPGGVAVVWSALDPVTDAVLLQTPVYAVATASVACVAIRTEPPCDVFLNGKPLAGAGLKRGFLKGGPNALCLTAAEPVTVEIEAGECRMQGTEGWRQCKTAATNWQATDFDDSQWAPAKAVDGKLDPAGGRHFRRVLAAQTTTFRHLGEPTNIHVAAGAAQHLPVIMGSPVTRTLRTGKLVIELPPGIERVECAKEKAYQWIGRYAGHRASAVRHNDATWTRHEFRWGDLTPVARVAGMHPAYSVEALHTFGVVLRETTGQARKTHLRMWVEGEDGGVRELPQIVPLTVVPPLGGKRPKTIELVLCHGFVAGSFSDPAELGALMDTWRDAGFTAYIERTGAVDVYNPLLYERGFRIIGEYPKNPEVRRLRNKENRFVDFDATHKGSTWTPLCPSWMVGEGRQPFVGAFAKYLRQIRTPLAGLWWDMEFGLKATCFCPRCLASFAKHAGIAGGVTRELVVEKHQEAWTDFYCELWAQVSAVQREALRACVPDGKMYTYSGYQTARNRQAYSIDWRRMGPCCDVASAGYGRGASIIAETRRALGTTPLVGGVAYYKPPRHANLKVAFLDLLSAGCRGVVHYQWAPLDGLDYGRIAEAASLIADHETFFLEGQRADASVTGPPADIVRALRLRNQLLALVFNPSGKPARRTCRLRGATGTAAEYYTGATYDAGQPITLTVPAHDARALTVSLAE